MASIVYRTDKKTGTVYALRSESYRDPVTKKPRNRKTYLGRVDPVTNMIIPKGEAGTRNTTKLGMADPERIPNEKVARLLAQKNDEILLLKGQIVKMQQKIDSLQHLILRMKALLAEYQSVE